MFRNLYLEKDGRKIDVTENGEMSCAYFVSNILLIWGLISQGHATIKSTIKDMLRSGWKKISINAVRPGDVIVWEEKLSNRGRTRFHMGFYIGDEKTVSHADGKKAVALHNWTYNSKRKITAVYRNEKNF